MACMAGILTEPMETMLMFLGRACSTAISCSVCRLTNERPAMRASDAIRYCES